MSNSTPNNAPGNANTNPAGSQTEQLPPSAQAALHFLDLVRHEFCDRRDVYEEFLNIMQDYKSQNIDRLDVIQRTQAFFQDYPALIQGFNAFLPFAFQS